MENIKASFYGYIIGDILGVPVEFSKREKLKENPVTDMIVTNRIYTRLGFWSDDTAMTLCAIKSITEKEEINYNDMADKFLKWFRNGYMAIDDRCFGIGQTTMQALMNYSKSQDVDATKIGLVSERSNGNGSLMRSLPIALFLYNKNISINEKKEIINNVSSITHAHHISKVGCVIYAIYIWCLIDEKDKVKAYTKTINILQGIYSNEELIEYERVVNGSVINLKEEEISSSGYVVDTLEASIWAFLTTDNYKDSVLRCINLGGDTDTVAAINGSLAGIYYGIDDIPHKWIDNIIEKDKIDIIIEDFDKII